MKRINASKWKLTFMVLPFVLAIILLKFGSHYLELEFLSLSPLFTAIISANIFLIGFLISGVLADYKESEKLPGDLAAALESIADECSIILMNKDSMEAKSCLRYIVNFIDDLEHWFMEDGKMRGTEIMNGISGFNKYFGEFEELIQANFISRLKQEQNTIRKIITRIRTIRDTSFTVAGYAIAEIITLILIIGFIFTNIDPYYVSVFFVAFVSFILIYMVLLIKDLDNPFEYHKGIGSPEEVPLTPIYSLKERLVKMTEFNK